MKNLIEQLDGVLETKAPEATPTLDSSVKEVDAWYDDESFGESVGWDAHMGLMLVAHLIEAFGELGESLILTPDKVAKEGGKIGQFFLPPQTISKTGEGTFPDAVELWWSAVTDALKSGKAFDLTDPKELKPLYGKIMSLWKDKIEAKYGFRPTRSKERSMQQDIDKQIKGAAASMRRSRGKENVDRAALSAAAKAMRARRTAKAKAKKAG